MSEETTEISSKQHNVESPINYESSRKAIIPLKNLLDSLILNGDIEQYSLALTGGAVYEPREPTDLDLFVIYKSKTEEKAGKQLSRLLSYDIDTKQLPESSHKVGHGIQGENYNPVKEMISSSSSGHRRLLIDGIEVDVQVDSEEQFLRILNETQAHSRYRLLGAKGFLYLACDRDDLPDNFRRAVWFLSPLLATADKKMNKRLSELIIKRYKQLENIPSESDYDFQNIFDPGLAEYLSSLGFLDHEELQLTFTEIKKAFIGNSYVNRPILKNLFNKFLYGMCSSDKLSYTFKKSLKTKVNNYWNGQNFVSHGIAAGALLIAGSNLTNQGETVFRNVDSRFLHE